MANKRNKKNKKKNNIKYLKSLKNQTFKHNGIKYHRSKDTVLIRIKDNIEGKYVGIKIGRSGNQVLFDKIYYANQQDAFIFMLDKKTYEKFGITNTMKMLKDEGMLMENWSGHFISEII